MSRLFSLISLRGLQLANRIVVSPMCQYAAVDGSATDWHLAHLGQLAIGAGALLMVEATHVSPVGRITPKCLGLYADDNEQALARVIAFCRQYGTSALGVQLAHAGRKASARPPLQGSGPLPPDENPWTTVAPSAVAYDAAWPAPRALDQAGLAEVKTQFVAATERARRLGFDLIELHAAHGYLMHEFLSPLSNRRGDGYGGSLEHRMRFPLEVFEAVRAAWPDDKPLGVRVSATDWVEGGWTIEDTVVFARELREVGCDFVDVSSGGIDPRQKVPVGPGYQVPFSARVRREADIPTWAVGMITEPLQAEQIIASGDADMVALARAMMFNPRWEWRAAEELGVAIPYADMYVRCHPSRWPRTASAR
jgi:2,4-dienoyl-CoA reductase-like NADH-dependent reductase (Old Yellow Enzyme family)